MLINKLFFAAKNSYPIGGIKRSNKLHYTIDIVNDLEKQAAVNSVNIEVPWTNTEIQQPLLLHIAAVERVDTRYDLKIDPLALNIAVRRPQPQLAKHPLKFQLDLTVGARVLRVLLRIISPQLITHRLKNVFRRSILRIPA